MNNVSQDIKDRINIEDLVGQYVQLKKVGRTLKGLCPFHSEKTPSFVVSPERGIAYCFGCNKGGDIFTFFQEMEGVDFPGAIKVLAERAGVKLEEYRGAGGSGGSGGDALSASGASRADQKEQMYALYEKATDFYAEKLWKTPEGQKVLEYVRRRGLSDETIKMWRLGFSPDSYDATYSFLLQKGFTRQFLAEAGLAMTKETTSENIYDRFRGRLMFPIWNGFGKVVAFGARALSKEQEPKYLNSPESAIYHKSSVLYGFFQSKQGLKLAGEAVIVEGYMDTIASFQAGVTNVVAPCGTALASRQLRLLRPFVDSIALAFDMDMAGQEAAKRAYEVARDTELAVKVVTLPDGKDPAEFAVMHSRAAGNDVGGAHGSGSEASGTTLADLMKNGLPYVDYFYQRLLTMYGTGDVAAKKTILREFLPFLHQLRSAVERDEYVRRLAHDLDIKESHVYDEIRNFRPEAPYLSQGRAAGMSTRTGAAGMRAGARGRVGGSDEWDDMERSEAIKRTREELLLGLMLEFPRMGKLLLEEIPEDIFPEALQPIYKGFCQQYNGDGLGSGDALISSLPHDIQANAALLSLYVSEKYGEMSEESVEKELKALLGYVRKSKVMVEQNRLQKELSLAEKEGNQEMKMSIMGRLNQIHQNH